MNCRPRVALLAAVAIMVSCARNRVSAPAEEPFAELQDASLRDRAVCDVLRRAEYAVSEPRYRDEVPPHGCKVRSVFDQTSRPRGAVVAVLDPNWTDPDLPDRPDAGHLVIFDKGGRLVPVFEAANYLRESDRVVTYTGDGAVAVVHNFGYAGDPDWSVDALHVVPVTEIGPLGADGAIDTKATYRYSQTTRRYVGPGGSLAGDFYVLPQNPPKCTWAFAEEFVRAHGITSGPTNGCSGRRGASEGRPLIHVFAGRERTPAQEAS